MAANQKMICIVVVAGFVALVAAQNIDPQKCAQNVQSAARTLRTSYQQIMSDLMQSLSKEAGSAVNTEKLSSQMNQMLSLTSSLADTQNGLSGERLTNTMSQIATTYMDITRTFLTLQPSVNTMRIFMRSMASSASAYATFVMQMPENCTP